jgi:hypothetical protein
MCVRAWLVVGVVGLAVGCSSSSGDVKSGQPPNSGKGAAGNGGGADAAAADAGGGTGGASTGGTTFGGFPDGEAPDCAVLVTQYTETIAGAQTCDVGASGQCQELVDDTLSACPSCMTYVNHAAIVNMIKADWLAIGCGSQPASGCPPLSCPQQTGGACVASAAGGTCAAQ